MRVVPVSLGDRSYGVTISGGGPEPVGEALVGVLGPRRVAVITDRMVGPLYADSVMGALAKAGCEAGLFTMDVGEEAKTVRTASAAWAWLLQGGYDRSAVVLALGGGVVGDMAGFVAATWMRGVDFVQCPTTLLAQVDSSVGGKTGFNLGGSKNMVGAFYQPRLVFASLGSLRTLEDRDYRAGMAEVIKHGVISRPEIISHVIEHRARIADRDPAVLAPLVADCCEVKRDVVQADERERGLRQVLNFGHTFGHAIETVTRHRLRHGEAVSLGMVAACRVSERLGYCGPEVREQVVASLSSAGLPVDDRQYWCAEVAEAMGADKKRRGAAISFIVARAVGHVEVVSFPAGELAEMVSAST